ncbi:energy-coupling factor transport system permease protein [Paramicrobacterium humi]|uniref:Energy-coupling factor transport system permease protein n=1 Tax=Paramicrobacterium humi TaxID=640635 RepID=A0A1H4MI86_9MICO|nr:energy-coupling factor transporter transmembrane component T [Microbacterium humi]SEB82776.1 energy-coupling factor transport system permease protein [Microbacterium humi]
MSLDPYAREEVSARHYLHALNPLAKIVAVLPVMVVIVFTRDVLTPLVLVGLAYLVLLTGVRLTRRRAAILFLALPLLGGILSLGFGLWTDPARVDHSVELFRVGGYRFYADAWRVGLATALRLVAIVSLALISGMSSTGPDLVRSAVQHARVPYRIGYAALASYRFVPRFRHELEVIRKAHRVRGSAGGRGPVAALNRGVRSIIPLLASAIRHAERVSLSMESRAFGAHETRTERYLVPLRTRDGVFVVVLWLCAAALVLGVRFFA